MKPIISINQWDKTVLNLINHWNQCSDLKNIRVDFKTKTFKNTYKLMKDILFSGFSNVFLNKNWVHENNIEVPGKLTSAILRNSFDSAQHLCNSPKYFFLKNTTLHNFLYNPANQTSTCLLLINNGNCHSIEEQLKMILRKFEYQERDKIHQKNQKWKTSFYLKSDEEIERIVEEQFLCLEDQAKRSVNLAMGLPDTDEWISENAKEEVIQVICDIFIKVRASPIFPSNFNLVLEYLNFVKDTEFKNFKINYLKVWGKGVWEQFVRLKKGGLTKV